MTNIFKIINESSLTEIIDEKALTVIIIMFGSKKCVYSKDIKPKFIELSKEYPEFFFIYVDMMDYKITENIYTEDIIDDKTGKITTPIFKFILNHDLLTIIPGAQYTVLKKTTNDIYTKINKIKKQNEMNELNEEINVNINNENNNSTNNGIIQSPINNINNTNNENIGNDKIQLMKNKIDILNKLMELVQDNKIILSKKYTLESDYPVGPVGYASA